MLKTIKQVDRFYLFLGIILAVLAVVVIIMLRNIFFAFQTASGAGSADNEKTIPRIDKVKLDEVYGKLYNQNPPQLDL